MGISKRKVGNSSHPPAVPETLAAGHDMRARRNAQFCKVDPRSLREEVDFVELCTKIAALA
jgi:hypothetical protein